MKNLNLIELYKIKKRIINEGMSDDSLMDEVLEAIKYKEYMILEDTSGTGGAPSTGMGAVISGQPSGLAGATIGTSWASGGGTVGSGDVSIPYNPSGANRMQQKVPVMGMGHGARTGKKTRKKRLDMKALKDVFAKRQDFSNGEGDVKKGEKKVMNFSDFAKSDINTIKK